MTPANAGIVQLMTEPTPLDAFAPAWTIITLVVLAVLVLSVAIEWRRLGKETRRMRAEKRAWDDYFAGVSDAPVKR